MASQSRVLTVGEVIDNSPVSGFQIWAIVFCGLVLTMDGFNAQSAGFLAPYISQTLSIPAKSFGPIFSASLFGLMLAAMASGPIADRWGRKVPVVFSTVLFAIFSILTARATSFNELLTYRFLTGLGLGGAMPNAVAIASEYSPKRLVPLFVAGLFAGMPLGGFICGAASSAMVPIWGWRSVFYLGGILPLVLALLAIKFLPESVRFLSTHGADEKKIAKILSRIAPDVSPANISYVTEEKQHKGVPVKRLFTEGRAPGTILLWIPFFMNLLILYFIASWLPTLLREQGMSVAAGVTATTLFSLGGIVGTLIEGPSMNSFGAWRLLFLEFLLCAVLIAAIAYLTSPFSLIVTATFLLGLFVTGAQAGINVLAASFYPTSIRSTGLGWALGIGRIGSIVGPMLAGFMLTSLGWSPHQIVLSTVIPALIAAAAVMVSTLIGGPSNAYNPEAFKAEASDVAELV